MPTMPVIEHRELSSFEFISIRTTLYLFFKSAYRLEYINDQVISSLPRNKGSIFIFNHESGLDPFLVAIRLPKQLLTLMKTDVGKMSPILYKITKYFGVIPVDTQKSNKQVIEFVEGLLRSKKFLGLAPEAAIHPRKKNYMGKPGFAWFAAKTKSPVVPVGVIGTRTVTPSGTFAAGIAPPLGRKIRVVFGKPVVFNGEVKERDVLLFRDCLMHEIRDLSNWEGVPKLMKEKLLAYYQKREEIKEKVVMELHPTDNKT